MFNLPATNLYRWWIPLAAIASLFAILLFVFPFNSGDSSLNTPLGLTLWAIWTGTGTDTDSDHTYCLLVPLMVAYLIWENRRELVNSARGGERIGVVWIIIGLVCFWLGARAGKQYMGFIGTQVLLYGLVAWFWGTPMFRKLLFAWSILIFAWPMPFLDEQAFRLRMIVSTTAHHVLSLIGVSNLQSGSALFSAPTSTLETGAKFQIDVAAACSGLHSLFPFLMFSSFYCYFFLPKMWQKWTVFLSTFLFAIVGNVFRIVALVIGCLLWGSSFAVGTNDHPSAYHEGCGFAVFVVGLGLECLFGYLLVRFVSRPGASVKPATAHAPAAEKLAPPQSPLPAWRSGTVFAFALVMFVLFLTNPTVVLPKEPGVLMSLPDEVKVSGIDGGHFYGSPAPVTDVEHQQLPKDTEYARKTYDDFHDHSVYFSIVLSGLQQYTIHPPERCLKAQGWDIVDTQYLPIKLNSGHDLTVCNLSLQRIEMDQQRRPHVVKAYYMYWYVSESIITASHFERNWRSSWDRIVNNRDHRWAYVIAMSEITDTKRFDGGLNAEQTRDLLTAFIRQIVPTFQKSEIPTQYTLNR